MSGTPGDILLQALDPDPTRAETKLASIRTLLIRYFEFNWLRDPEDLAQEVICRVIKSLDEGKKITATKPQSYFYGFAANILKEQRKAFYKQSVSMIEDPSTHHRTGASQRELDSMEARIYLDECGQVLEPDERELLLSYYLDGREKLSRRMGITVPNLTLQIHRLKKRIRGHVNKESKTDTSDR